jgi:AbrB family looped-hinge helix DNA binding protein
VEEGAAVRITTKGQVTIPMDIREKLGLLPDTEVEFHVSGNRAVLEKAKNRRRRGAAIVERMRGRATRRMSTDEIMALTRAE